MYCSYQRYALACVSALIHELWGYCLSDSESKKVLLASRELYLIAKKHRDALESYRRRHPVVHVSVDDDLPF